MRVTIKIVGVRARDTSSNFEVIKNHWINWSWELHSKLIPLYKGLNNYSPAN